MIYRSLYEIENGFERRISLSFRVLLTVTHCQVQCCAATWVPLSTVSATLQELPQQIHLASQEQHNRDHILIHLSLLSIIYSLIFYNQFHDNIYYILLHKVCEKVGSLLFSVFISSLGCWPRPLPGGSAPPCAPPAKSCAPRPG